MPKKKTKQREMLEIAGAFVIAWFVYQILSLTTGTALPIVSVVSDSMYHTSHFDGWWDENSHRYTAYEITKEQFSTFLAPNGLSRGDLVFVVRADDARIGDILVYERGISIIHRLVMDDGQTYITKGDNNPVADEPVNKERVSGKAVFVVPVLGYPRYIIHCIYNGFAVRECRF